MAASIPSLNWLRVFEAAARAESFARAAQELNMSAAAVSQQVRALEERLGAQLFERQAHAVRLTDMGRAYLPGVQQALLTLQSTTEGLFGAVRAQQLYVQAVLLFAHGILADGFSDFTQAHPDIVLSLSTGNSAFEFSQGFTDLQIIFGNPSAYGAEGDMLMGEVLYPVVRPELARTIKTASDLTAHPLIEVSTHRAGWPYVFEDLGIRQGGARYVYADNTLMAFALARAGAGIALARAPASDRALADSGLVACLPGLMVDGREAYHLVYPSLAALRPPARAFRRWIMAWCAAQKTGAKC